RYGGEEFVVIAPHCPLAGAMKTAERFRDRLAAAPVVIDRGPALTVTVSVGVASVTDDSVDSPAALLAPADRALYQAKARGRNQVVCLALPEPDDTPQPGWALARVPT